MTVLSLPWRASWLRRRTAWTRRPWATRHPARPQRPAYHDPFFANPTLVEDDARRLTSQPQPRP
jgi:hypothetical protein